MKGEKLSRRTFLRSTLIGIPLAPGLYPLFQEEETQDPTEDNIEGPYFRPNAPWRTTLYDKGEKGDVLVLSGTVHSRNGRPLPNAEIEVWQATAEGRYDNDDEDHPPKENEFRLRGRLKTDAKAAYSFETVRPGRYKMSRTRYRPAHIHIKVHHEGHRSLTTQLYFKDEELNKSDPWYKPSLALELEPEEGRFRSRFDFVLRKA